MAEGQLTYVRADDCIERVYPAGTPFIDPGHGNVHTATLFQPPEEGALTIPVSDPGFDPC